MKSIDKNDVDISILFNWGKQVRITDAHGKELLVAYIRLVGDEDLNKARSYSLRKSAEYRKKLRDKNSDEHLAYIQSIESFNKHQIIDLIILSEIRSITTRATNQVVTKIPTEPGSDEDLEAMEQYQAEVDAWPEKRQEELNNFVLEEIERRRTELDKLTTEELEDDYFTAVINNLTETEMYNSFIDICTYFGTYKDSEYTKRMFETLDQFNSLPSVIKDQFVTAYSTLTLSIDDLKK